MINPRSLFLSCFFSLSFSTQSNECSATAGTCLENQIKDLIDADTALLSANKTTNYLLSGLAKWKVEAKTPMTVSYSLPSCFLHSFCLYFCFSLNSV